MGPDAMILVSECWVLSQLFHSLCFMPYGWCHLRLLIFLSEILIPACASSSPAFLMMYSIYKQGNNIQPWCTPFPVWNQSVVLCSVLTDASWPAYRSLRRQVKWSGIRISLRIFHSLLQSSTLFILEEEMAIHSSILAWKIPWTEEPGGLRSMGLQRRTQLSGWASTHTIQSQLESQHNPYQR